VGLLERLKTNNLLVSKNPEKKERYLEVKPYKTLRTDDCYNLDIKGA